MNPKKGAIIMVMLVAISLTAFLVFLRAPDIVQSGPDVAVEPGKEEAISTAFNLLDLRARSVVVWDVKNNEPLFVKNAHETLPLASLTKVMTALVALESSGSGATVTIQPEDLAGEGDQGLRSGEVWSLADLIDFTLMTSSNDGALSLAAAGARAASESVPFVRTMNAKADAIGLKEMFFLNPTGLDTTSYLSGGYGSAYDMARLFSYALARAPAVFEATASDRAIFFSKDGTAHYAENTNEIVDRIPWLLASKTGFTDLAGGNLAVAFDVGMSRPVVVVVLGSTQDGRFRDVEQLIKATFAFFEQR